MTEKEEIFANRTSRELRHALESLIESVKSDGTFSDDLVAALKDSFIRFGSETEDNTEAMRRITFSSGPLSSNSRIHATQLCISNNAGRNISLSEISWALESLSLPAQLVDIVPGIDHDSWKSSMRVITLLLSSLGPHTGE